MNVTLPIHRHALRQPNKPALIGERRTLTYRELDLLISRSAALFRSLGFGAGDAAALLISEPIMHLVASLGLARLGVACYAVGLTDTPAMVRGTMQRINVR